jgi:ankyrin repeat protein
LLKEAAASGATVATGTALNHAARHGYTVLIELLLDGGADIEAVSGGFTPLQQAARHGRRECATRLLFRGADAAALASEAGTAAEVAEANGHLDLARELRELSTAE